MKNWVTDLSNYSPISLGGHWGDNQAGFNVSKSGRIWLTDNASSPCHRDLHDGEGDDATVYSGIYSWNNDTPEIYVYPYLKQIILDDGVISALNSLVGVHDITSGVEVIDNSSRKVIYNLGCLNYDSAKKVLFDTVFSFKSDVDGHDIAVLACEVTGMPIHYICNSEWSVNCTTYDKEDLKSLLSNSDIKPTVLVEALCDYSGTDYALDLETGLYNPMM